MSDCGCYWPWPPAARRIRCWHYRRFRRLPDHRRVHRIPAPPRCPASRACRQCAQHVIRRARQVMNFLPGGVQNWASDIISILGDAPAGRYRKPGPAGSTGLDPKVLDDLRERYDAAVKSGTIHNRLRDWDSGGTTPAMRSRPGCAPTRNRSSCSPGTSASASPITSAKEAPRPPSATRPSPATGTAPPQPSPAGAASAATSTQPPPTASPHSMPARAAIEGNPLATAPARRQLNAKSWHP